MGNCTYKSFGGTISNVSGQLLDAKLEEEITEQEIRELFRKNKINDSVWKQLDLKYKCISMDSFNMFRTTSCIYAQDYKPEIFDCDDYTLVFLGRVKEWYGKNEGFSASIGFMSGDIRLKKGDPLRGHAVAFFISNKELYIYEPQYNDVYKYDPEIMKADFLLM